MLRTEAGRTRAPAARLKRDKGVRALPRGLGIEDVEGRTSEHPPALNLHANAGKQQSVGLIDNRHSRRRVRRNVDDANVPAETRCAPRSLRQFPSARSRAPLAVGRAVVRCSSERARSLRHERVDCRRRSHWDGLRCSAWYCGSRHLSPCARQSDGSDRRSRPTRPRRHLRRRDARAGDGRALCGRAGCRRRAGRAAARPAPERGRCARRGHARRTVAVHGQQPGRTFGPS